MDILIALYRHTVEPYSPCPSKVFQAHDLKTLPVECTTCAITADPRSPPSPSQDRYASERYTEYLGWYDDATGVKSSSVYTVMRLFKFHVLARCCILPRSHSTNMVYSSRKLVKRDQSHSQDKGTITLVETLFHTKQQCKHVWSFHLSPLPKWHSWEGHSRIVKGHNNHGSM
jgi:hypothetical protein